MAKMFVVVVVSVVSVFPIDFQLNWVPGEDDDASCLACSSPGGRLL